MSPRSPLVATIVAPSGSGLLTEARLTEARGLLLSPDAGAAWLAPNEAADLALASGHDGTSDVAALLDAWRHSHGLDVFVQPREGRRKRLLVADMDSTMIGQECIDELADVTGLKPRVAAITDRAMRGEVAFEPALRERVALLEGLPETAVAAVLAERITLMPGGLALVRTMRANGAFCALVSGGFTVFTGPVARLLGFDEHRGNLLLMAEGRFTGEVASPILGREAKLQALVELRTRLKLSRADVLAVGDGANDLAMLGEAGFGVAFHAKPAVAAAAHAQVDYGDLSALLYAQGFTSADIVDR